MISLNARLLRRQQRRDALRRGAEVPAPIPAGRASEAEIAADLAKLADVPTDHLIREARKLWVARIAAEFVAPAAVAEARLAGIGPFRAPPTRTWKPLSQPQEPKTDE